MKRYNIWLEKWREGEETYYDLETQADKNGEWVKAEVALDKIKRMQKRIDELEGRVKKERVPVYGMSMEDYYKTLHKVLHGEM